MAVQFLCREDCEFAGSENPLATAGEHAGIFGGENNFVATSGDVTGEVDYNLTVKSLAVGDDYIDCELWRSYDKVKKTKVRVAHLGNMPESE
jgi:hypothetical protein